MPGQALGLSSLQNHELNKRVILYKLPRLWCSVTVHVISATQEAEVGGSWSKAAPGQKQETPSEKQTTKAKGLGGVAQVVELFPSKHKAQYLTSSPK
jgi:hypothetical protein